MHALTHSCLMLQVNYVERVDFDSTCRTAQWCSKTASAVHSSFDTPLIQQFVGILHF